MEPFDRISQIHRLEESRMKIEELLPRINVEKDIYPGWSIRHLLAHISGWDDALIDALRAHVKGCPPSVQAIQSLDKYNNLSVSSREELTYGQILSESRSKRQAFLEIIEQLPEEKLHEPVAVPWGKKTTLTRLVKIFSSHEEEHAQDIIEWLKHPDTPLQKAGE